jgi:hypothetical protein
MQIGSISSGAGIQAISPVSPVTTRGPGSSSSKAGSSEANPAGATTDSSLAASSKAGNGTAASTSSTSLSPAATQSQGVVGSAAQTLDVVYTTKVAGHSYVGGVQQAAGEYIASAVHPPDPPINAVGTSVQAAENNLSFIIDQLV